MNALLQKIEHSCRYFHVIGMSITSYKYLSEVAECSDSFCQDGLEGVATYLTIDYVDNIYLQEEHQIFHLIQHSTPQAIDFHNSSYVD